MNIEQVSEQMVASLRNVTIRWYDLCTIWDDAVRKDFEQHYVEPLQVQVEALGRAMDDLAGAVEYARNVIEDG